MAGGALVIAVERRLDQSRWLTFAVPLRVGRGRLR